MTITLTEMTRFLLSLDRAVDTVFEAMTSPRPRRDICAASSLGARIRRRLRS